MYVINLLKKLLRSVFRTIFGKLIVIFVVIVVFSFSIAGVTLYYSLSNYFPAEKIKNIEQSAEEISYFFNLYMNNKDNPLAYLMLNSLLKKHAANNGSIVWIINSKGYIVYPAASSIPSQIFRRLKVDESGLVLLPDEKQYKKVISGQDPVIEKGYFYGLFKDTGWSWLTVEKPLKLENQNSKDILAAVIFSTPISEVNKTLSSVFDFFMISTAVSIVLSFILVYIFSLRITRPLKEINNAARVIAGGEFKKRLNISSHDEIGELAGSFNQMVVALQNLEVMRSGFIANISHELRTPMTSIRGFIEGILDGTIPPEKQENYLLIVKDEIIRLNRLVNDLLDLARMEAGEVNLTFISFDINELIRRCIIKLESMIVKKKIQIQADFECDEMYVNADADAIERVVINLLHNAVKFTHEGGTVAVRTASSKEKIFVTIEDNGIGIDKEELGFIWERFYKSDKSRSEDKTGTGLGLAIVKNIINEHRQEVQVESELGKGTKFTFTLARNMETDTERNMKNEL